MHHESIPTNNLNHESLAQQNFPIYSAYVCYPYVTQNFV